MPDSTENNQRTTDKPMSYELSFLIKLIPETFDGDRYKIRSFIKQVDGAFELASAQQKPALLLYVKSRITGKAREQIDIHCSLTTWEEISDLLLNLYHDKKTLDQLFEELNSIHQMRNENVSQYYQRIEDLSSRILATIHTTEQDETLLPGSIAMVTKITLNRFIYHTHPQISQMLRYREFTTINRAFTAAVTEEKALRMQYNSYAKCRHCGRSNHTSDDCRLKNRNSNSFTSREHKQIHFSQENSHQNTFKNQNQSQNPNRFNNQRLNQNSNRSNSQKTCNYCKKSGHVIEECIKRFAANVKKNRDNASQNRQQSSVNVSNPMQNKNFQTVNRNLHQPELSEQKNEAPTTSTTLNSFAFHIPSNNNELTYILFESPHSDDSDQILKFLVDTGAAVSLVKASSIRNYKIINPEPIILNGIKPNAPIMTLGQTELNLSVNSNSFFNKFHVLNSDTGIPFDGLVGQDFFQKHNCKINYQNSTISIDALPFPLPLQSNAILFHNASQIIIQPRSEIIAKISLMNPLNLDEGIITGQFLDKEEQVLIPTALVKATNKKESFITIINRSAEEKIIPKPCLPLLSPPHQMKVFHINNNSNNLKKRHELLHENLRTEHLNPEEKQSLTKLCEEFHDIFNLPDDKLSYTSATDCKIPTIDNIPIQVKSYRYPEVHKNEVSNQIEKMMKQGIIKPSVSPWSSPL
ncbi:uncharacterized protein LOC135161895 [Diachasmimorpha longicaudata]|uniref:uncharacterized protein LOC135161895 n=1 Tax=Diachasmimorpha longicaudata TaxID=58733 RepID=UPI0030B8AD16